MTYTHTYIEITGPVRLRVIDPKRTACAVCNGPFAWTLDARGDGGASFGDTFLHKPDCASLFCEHGKPWPAGCDDCDATQEKFEEYDSP